MRSPLVRAARRALRGLFVLALAPAALSAQSVTGRVLEVSTRRPLARVTVTLLDSVGRPAARAETLADGVFYLDAPAPGTYVLDFASGEGAPHVRAPERVIAAGQEAQVEFMLALGDSPAPESVPTSAAVVLLGDWYDRQPPGWPELRLKIVRVDGDSVFGELTEMGRTTTTFLVRGRYSAPRVELRVARAGFPEAHITGVLKDGYIVAQHVENKDYDSLLPAIRFGRRRY